MALPRILRTRRRIARRRVRRRVWLGGGLVLLLLLGAGGWWRLRHMEAGPAYTVAIGPSRFVVEVAADDVSRYRGLSGRARMADDAGMLFVYPAERPKDDMVFVMRRCLFDIDIAFINAQRKIVTIHTMKVEPPDTPEAYLVRYPATADAQFALEVRGGQFARRGIRVGDAAEFSPEIEKLIPSSARD
ncbi:MAG: hypothetical protein BIFFINMI_01486 [Phycisphaerae bacterium]|nr:hypothetical protein [Phycisphaerae bacterium]